MSETTITIKRIRNFLAKWSDNKPKPAAVRMTSYLLGLLDADVEDRVQALLADMLEADKQHKSKTIELGQWMTEQIDSLKSTKGDTDDDQPNQNQNARQHQRRQPAAGG